MTKKYLAMEAVPPAPEAPATERVPLHKVVGRRLLGWPGDVITRFVLDGPASRAEIGLGGPTRPCPVAPDGSVEVLVEASPTPAPTEPEGLAEWNATSGQHVAPNLPIQCSRCGGEGWLMAEGRPRTTIECPLCRGTGSKPVFRTPEPTPDPPAETAGEGLVLPDRLVAEVISGSRYASENEGKPGSLVPLVRAATALRRSVDEGLVERLASVIELAESEVSWEPSDGSWGARSARDALEALGWPGGDEVAVWLNRSTVERYAHDSRSTLSAPCAAALRTPGEPTDG